MSLSSSIKTLADDKVEGLKQSKLYTDPKMECMDSLWRQLSGVVYQVTSIGWVPKAQSRVCHWKVFEICSWFCYHILVLLCCLL
jgi:hypothetical protein